MEETVISILIAFTITSLMFFSNSRAEKIGYQKAMLEMDINKSSLDLLEDVCKDVTIIMKRQQETINTMENRIYELERELKCRE